MSKHEKTAHELLQKAKQKISNDYHSRAKAMLRENIQFALEKAEVYKTCTDGSYEAALDYHDFFSNVEDLKAYLYGEDEDEDEAGGEDGS